MPLTLPQLERHLFKAADMPHGLLFRKGDNHIICDKIFDDDLFEAVIGISLNLPLAEKEAANG